MFSLLLITLTCICLFTAGYYFGHQIGSTHHIRQRLSESRKNRSQEH
jgi:uncharacterized membrane protein YciS (DUF1049 family)